MSPQQRQRRASPGRPLPKKLSGAVPPPPPRQERTLDHPVVSQPCAAWPEPHCEPEAEANVDLSWDPVFGEVREAVDEQPSTQYAPSCPRPCGNDAARSSSSSFSEGQGTPFLQNATPLVQESAPLQAAEDARRLEEARLKAEEDARATAEEEDARLRAEEDAKALAAETAPQPVEAINELREKEENASQVQSAFAESLGGDQPSLQSPMAEVKCRDMPPVTDVDVPEDLPLYKCTTSQLRAIARQKGLPRVEGTERVNLMENIRMVREWETKDVEGLERERQLRGISTSHRGSKESIIRDLIDEMWGEKVAAETPSPEPAVQASAGQARQSPVPMPTPSSRRLAPSPQPVPLPQRCSSGRSSSSTARINVEKTPEESLALEVRRINLISETAVRGRDFRQVLGFALGEPMTLQLAKSRYRSLMLLLHPDKRTAAGEERAGGHNACEKALDRVQEANRHAQVSLARGPTTPPPWVSTPAAQGSAATRARTAGPPSAPPPPAAHKPAAAARPKPPPPSGSKHPRPFGQGPLNPLPAPHPNFGVLQIVFVD